ncbi:Pentatricopeptide repeat-containing protein [Abeliophyllum distichum]|uniref:Pentatricopeptide repeat-containing protein n=1 Tax=Abeliophyllum distichum TaxID=126358 RepID=A0ABD1SDH5_9LAMI
MVVSQVTNDFKQNEESVEVAEGNQSRNTIEELDGFCKEGKLKEVVELLGLLEQQHVLVDFPWYLMLTKACGENKALQEAKSVHEHLVRSILHLEVKTYNKILEMYSECGSMDDAFAVFDQMPKRNLTSWDIMILWLAKNGLEEDSIELFAEIKRSGLKPDGQMFIGVFSVCGVLGDIVEGMLHFESMSNDYGITAFMEHYVSVVPMLGRAGCLDEALEFIEQMPIEPEDKRKLSGQNPLDVWSRVYEYRAGDRYHPNHEKIYTLLRELQKQMKDLGHLPETKFVLYDVDHETKEEALMAHSERLAAAQGFMNSPPRSTLRIIKNLRVCRDCHNALKIISTIVGREIID